MWELDTTYIKCGVHNLSDVLQFLLYCTFPERFIFLLHIYESDR